MLKGLVKRPQSRFPQNYLSVQRQKEYRYLCLVKMRLTLEQMTEGGHTWGVKVCSEHKKSCLKVHLFYD